MPDTYTIHNDQLTVTIKRKGAELCSVKDTDGFEYMWQAGDVWPRHAPNLFPIVGSLLDHQYTYEGKTYDLSHHGFARNIDFDMLHQSEHSICFVLMHSQETLTSFPFKFSLLITYTLSGNRLDQRFRVVNNDEKPIPASYGGHPAFNASPISDYVVEFSHSEDVKANILNGPYIGLDEREVITDKKIVLDEHTFDDDALIFQELKSQQVSLVHTKSNHEVAMDISEFPYLGIWAKPGAPYVCLEPWQGLADFTSHNKAIEDKKGVVWIPQNEESSKTFTMSFYSDIPL